MSLMFFLADSIEISSPLRRSFSMMLPVDFRRLSTWWMGLWS